MLMLYDRGYWQREIAEVLRVTQSKVSVRLACARAKRTEALFLELPEEDFF